MSLLSIINGDEEGAAVLCGLTPPSTIFGSTDPNVPLLLRLAQQEGRELSRRHDWQALKVDYTVPTVATELQTAFPADFHRLLPYPELWNRSLALQYSGPTDDTTWGRLKALNINSGIGSWRLIGNQLAITPNPVAGQTLAFPYISKNWARSSLGAAQSRFSADTDTAVLPESLFTLGIVWRWKKSKGFDYAEDMATYEREVERACSRDRGLGVIQVGKPRPPEPATWPGTIIV
jgi:hypothetical protein